MTTTTQGECINGITAIQNSVGGNSCDNIDNYNPDAAGGMRLNNRNTTTTTTNWLHTNGNTTTNTNNNNNNKMNGLNQMNNNNNNANNMNRNISNNKNNNNNNNNITNNTTTLCDGSESTKRKKLKSRNASLPSNGTAEFPKDHLDAWLETCLKDASNAQLSSSSEFLDYNPTPNTQHNGNPRHYIKQSQQQQQQQFAMRTNPPGNGPFSQGFQRNFMKHNGSHSHNNRYSHMFPNTNGGSSAVGGISYYGQSDGQDFTSLPPIVNLLGNSREMEQHSSELLDGGSNSNPNISRGFRFSDPCLLNPSDNDSKLSGQNTPDRRVPSDMDNNANNNKFFTALMEQINMLHETNTKICRNLHETKVDIEALKHAPTWGMRHRRDSLSGLSTHSQPMVFGGGFGTQSPAPTFHSGAYTPGMMTDVVREVKEAARVREDALLNKVKSMVEERQWSTNEYNLRIMRDIEELKSQIQNMRIERKESNKRISHLETENKYMRHMLTSLLNARSSDKLGDTNGPRERKPFPNTQRRGSQTLYSLQKQQQQLHASLDEQDETGWAHMVDTTPSTTSTIDVAATAENGKTPQKTEGHNNNNNNNNSVSSSDSERINGTSPPGFSLITPTTIIEAPKRKKDIEKLEIEQHSNLRRELNAAVVARKEADKRIIALETLVKTLTINTAQYVDGNGATNSSHMSNGVGEQTNTTTTTNNSLLLSGGGGGQANVMAKYNKLQQQHHNIVGTHKLFASSQSQPQQQQQQPHQSSASSSLNLSSPSSKLSLAGPITDL